RIPTVGYAASDAWVVGDGGVVRIVRTGGYRIETLAPGATAVTGPSYAYETRPVTAADRIAYVRRFNETSPMSGKGPNGGMGYSPKMSEADLAAMAQGTQYAERHPMFADVVAGPSGRLWVGHPAEDGKPVIYDVFDGSGKRVSLVELKPGRRVAAVGRQSVYVVAETEEGVQRLERYAVPQ
ncbi:MAG TPA: hypothetical protein VFU23_10960, partial [Gemmatimonadales bacterium]|nr:hypothetical protein [Gemmatimonadales bacterium]